MRTVLQIFLRDLRRILKNPVALVVTLGVCVIPALYAWFNVAAAWDPYGNTSALKVAVVNADRPVENDMVGRLEAGSEVVDQLRANDQLGWTFEGAQGNALTEGEALQGVKAGTYYAAIVIPEDFSAGLASISSGDFQKPSLTYYINERRNTVAPEITDVGAKTVQDEVSGTFVGTVAKVVADKMGELGGKMLADTDSVTSDVIREVDDVRSALQSTRDSLGGVTGSIDAAKAVSASARTTLDALAGQASGARDTLADATGRLSAVRSDASTLSSRLASSLTSGATTLAGISGDANAAVGTITGKVSQAQAVADGALATARGITVANQDMIDRATQLAGAIPDSMNDVRQPLLDALGKLQDINDGKAQLESTLQTASDDVKAGADAVAGVSDALNGSIHDSVGTIADVDTQLQQTALPALNGALDSFASASGSLQGVLGGLDPTISQARGVLDQLDATLDQASDATALVDETLGDVNERLQKVSTDVSALQAAAATSELSKLLDIDASRVGDFMTSPVTLDTKVQFPVEKYGAGAAPFYTNLAIWVGGFVLIAIYKQEVDGEGLGAIRPWQGYLGRWLLFALVGIVQAAVVCVGDLVMGIQCANPAAFVFAGIVESLVYVQLIFALGIAFKHIGKAIAVILVILQIPGASGLYPIEMMPGLFQAVEPFLPFTYGIRAMREAIGGFYGNHYAVALLQLCLFLVPALVVGLGLRRHLLNVNVLFDRRLAATDLLVCEESGMPNERYKLTSIVKALVDQGEYREAIAVRAARFERLYPRLVRGGFLLLPIGTLALLVVLFVVDAKLPALVAWVTFIVVVVTVIIAIEYFHESLVRKGTLASMGRDEVQRLLDERLDQELRPAAPLQAMRACTCRGAKANDPHAAEAARAGAEPADGTDPDAPAPAGAGTEQDAPVPADAGTSETIPMEATTGEHEGDDTPRARHMRGGDE